MIEMNQKRSFPTLNLYSSPRVSGDRVNNAIVPLLRYMQPVTANNCIQNYEDNFVKPSLCRKLKEKDGLIYMIKNMKKEIPEIGTIKALICVCMYN